MSKAYRNDAYAKVTGRAKYTDDITFPRMLHGVPVYSEYVHAKINSVDTTEAESFPGVVKIITAKDVTGSNTFGQIIKDYQIFADKKIFFNGDVAAVVVAETRKQAIAASMLVKVDAESLPAILNPEDALKAEAE